MDTLEALRRAQAATGANNTSLARGIGVSRQFVSSMFSDRRDPKASTVARMCAAMGCELVVRLPGGEELLIGAGGDTDGPNGDA